MDIRELVRFGTAAHGHEWQSRLARDLTGVKGASVSPAQVAHWTTGRRPIPEWVAPALIKLAASTGPNLRGRADIVEHVAAVLSRQLNDGSPS